MMSRILRIIVLLGFFCAIALAYLLADACRVYGIVYDKDTGQPLQGAEVLLINQDTKIPSRTVTNEKGEYAFDLVYPPGLYTVRVTLRDYGPAEFRGLQVRINDTAVPVPPIRLERGASPVTLEGRSVVINASDSVRKVVFEPESVQSLPLSGIRTFDQLALLAPGVADVPAAAGTGPGVGPGVGTAGQFSVNGQRGRNNNFMVDMSDNNDQDVGVRRQGYVSLVPQSIESIQNYQVLSSNYQAEFGRNSGSIVNAISRTGGNNFHGSIYGYFINDALMARNFFDQNDGPAPGQSPYRRAQYGFVAGGPLTKNRTFWFTSLERQRVKDRPEKHFSVPTFSERNFFGYSPLIYSPGNLQLSNGDLVDDLSQFFLSQNIGHIALAGRGVWSLVPLPNNPVGPYGLNTYTEQMNGDGDGTIVSLKLDHKFPRQSTFTARYNFTNDGLTVPVTGGAIHSSIHPEVRTQNLSLFLNSILSTRAANQARFSFGRTRLNFLEVPGSPLLFGSTDQAAFRRIVTPDPIFDQILKSPIKPGFGAGTYGPFGTTGALGQLLVQPYSPVGVDVLDFPQARTNNTFQSADTLIYRLGSHTFRTGVDIRRVQQNSLLDRNLRPVAEFAGAVGSQINLLGGIVRGTDLASVGYATGFLQTLIPDFNGDGVADFDSSIALRFTEIAAFVQDDWRLGKNLNLSFGVRYEYSTPPSEASGKIEKALQNPSIGIPSSNAPAALAVYERDFDSIVRALSDASSGRSSIFDPQTHNWMPRVGLAWDPTGSGKTSVRAGYGVFFDQTISAVTSQSRNVFPHLIPMNSSGISVPIEGLFLTSPQFLVVNDLSKNPPPLIRPGTISTLGIPGGYFRAVMGLLNRDCGQGIAFTLPTRNLPTPYAEHYHFTLERELARNLAVSAAYAGSRGIHLTRFRNPNGGIAGNPAYDVSASPDFKGLNAWIGKTQFYRQDSRLGAYTVLENTGSSNYHSLQLMAQGKLPKHLQFTGSYTWSHALDDVSDVFDGLGYFAGPQAEANLRAEHASANFDVRHRFSASYVWTLPWGESNGFLGGWTLAGIFVARTGQPFTVNTSFDVNKDGTLTDRLNTTQGIQRVNNGSILYVLPQGALRDRAAVSFLASPGKNGAVGRNTFRANGISNLDFSILKRFRLSDSSSLEFRSEFFNLFNHTEFGMPVRILEAPGFGRSTNTLVGSRQIQLALKLIY